MCETDAQQSPSEASSADRLCLRADGGRSISAEEVDGLVGRWVEQAGIDGKRLLVIVPDATRTAPVGMVFKAIHRRAASRCAALDVLVALGTHPPMSEEAICNRLDISPEERGATFSAVGLFNHEWKNPSALHLLGVLPASEINDLSGGLFSMDVPVEINRRLLEYDAVLLVGPVFPHEVVGCSGGNKYLFPGVSGPRILDFFHWLGAVITNPMIIGNKWTPVRKVVDRASSLLPIPRHCFCLVVHGGRLVGMDAGTPEEAWDSASDLSRSLHIVRKPRPFHTVLSRAPLMYDDLWVGAKCMYKLEPVVADGGELIIYAPHIREVSVSHGELIEKIGYHCRDYFLKQWELFRDLPWGVLAHLTHLRGLGTFDVTNGIEHCRIRVTLATGIPRETCRRINLGYRDPRSLRIEEFAGREEEGILDVPSAGETLYHLETRPDWAVG